MYSLSISSSNSSSSASGSKTIEGKYTVERLTDASTHCFATVSGSLSLTHHLRVLIGIVPTFFLASRAQPLTGRFRYRAFPDQQPGQLVLDPVWSQTSLMPVPAAGVDLLRHSTLQDCRPSDHVFESLPGWRAGAAIKRDLMALQEVTIEERGRKLAIGGADRWCRPVRAYCDTSLQSSV